MDWIVRIGEEAAVGWDMRDIRPGMDVFSFDNQYLGSVLRVIPGRWVGATEAVSAGARQSSIVLGELLGPAPTLPIGNRAPVRQSARQDYRIQPDGATPIGSGVILVGRWWGLVDRREVPLAEVLNVSLERVVLRQTRRELSAGPA